MGGCDGKAVSRRRVSGNFTLALQRLIPDGAIYAMDKNPHMLWRLQSTEKVTIEVIEGDFTRPFDMPAVGGMVMANALHYAEDHLTALMHCLEHLDAGGTFICVEYNTDRPSPPYVPYPIPENRLVLLFEQAGLTDIRVTARKPSIYQEEMYVLVGKNDC